jgi:hypothetical protein
MSTRPASSNTDADMAEVPLDRRGWVLIAVSVACILAAIGLTSVWYVSSSDDRAVVLDITDATADPPPSTVAPTGADVTATAPDTGPAPARRTEAAAPASGSSDEASLLADLVGPRSSVIPEPVQPRPQPVGITTSSIDIDEFPIRPVGLEDDGQLEVPDETEIGWYRYGATAGRPGATVLAAHVSWNRTTGPFFELGSMAPGDEISIVLDDGTTRRYVVTERTKYNKNELPRERIWRTTGDEQLVLITCGGDFNPEIRRYSDNIVVYAAPVG